MFDFLLDEPLNNVVYLDQSLRFFSSDDYIF